MTKRKSLIAALAFSLAFSLTLIFGVTLSSGIFTADAATSPDEKTLISLVKADVIVPVPGEKVEDSSATVKEGESYKIYTTNWYKGADTTGAQMMSAQTFAEGGTYTVKLRIQTEDSTRYAFDVENVRARINNKAAKIMSPSEKLIIVTYTFTATSTPAEKHSVTVVNGTLEDGSRNGEFETGEIVTIIADDAIEGKVFYEWVAVSDNISIAGYYFATTTFEMEDEDVEIKADYRTVVPFVELTVRTPIAGEIADSNALSYATGKGYTATLIWTDENGAELSAGTTFQLGVEYRIKIEVEVSDRAEYMFTKNTVATLNDIGQMLSDRHDFDFMIKEFFVASTSAPEYYDIKIIGGRAEIERVPAAKSPEGIYVDIIADEAPAGEEFDRWVVVSGGVTFDEGDEYLEESYFEMPACNVEIKATFKANHEHNYVPVDGKPASCAETGLKKHYKCSECSRLFDENKAGISAENLVIAVDPDAHDLEAEWKGEKGGHYHVCKNAGCPVGHDEMQAHTPDREEATGTEPVKCTVCGYTITPVVGHTHNLTLVSEKGATCTENGTKSHYICADCGHKFADSAAENEITDESTLTIRMAHSFGEWIEEVPATTESIGVKGHKDCEFCHKHFDKDGNEIEDLTIAKLPDGGGSMEEPTENKGLSGGAIAGIVGGSVAVAGVGGFAIFWFVVKKKSFAELIAIFKK